MGDIGSILLGSVFAGLIWLTAQSLLDFICMAAFHFPRFPETAMSLPFSRRCLKAAEMNVGILIDLGIGKRP